MNFVSRNYLNSNTIIIILVSGRSCVNILCMLEHFGGLPAAQNAIVSYLRIYHFVANSQKVNKA